jgi:NADH-quinone oxidoreductase subunit E
MDSSPVGRSFGAVRAPDGAAKRPRKRLYTPDPLAEPAPPAVAEIVARHRGRRDALIAVLQDLQDAFGYLPERPLRYAARDLGIPLSRIYGVATFYNQFRFSAPGEHKIQICRGTACHVSHSPVILAAVKAHLAVAEDQTTADGVFTLQTVACMGCCSLAPAMMVDETVYGRMTPEGAVELLDRIRAGKVAV